MKREQWSSNLGFLLAAAGSAVGLGNLWKFPYIAGSNGGAIFLVVYLILLALLGVPLLLSEMAVGRSTHKNAIDACKAIHPKWGFVGGAGVLGALIILSYYSVIGGWVLKYFFLYLFGAPDGDAAAYFDQFSARTAEPILWHIGFGLICVLIVSFGVSKGIERVSKLFLPMLVVALVILVIYAMTLPGSMQGVKFLFFPDRTHVTSIGDLGTIIVRAMGQVFFSMSIGMGTLITYGSYLDKNANLQKNAIVIPIFDLLIALLAGLAILPCVFSVGMEPTAGSGLLFQALPHVFETMHFGRAFAVLFFALVFFAAVTSAISLLESIVAFLIDRLHWKRQTAALLSGATFLLLGFGSSLSFGLWSDRTFLGLRFFDWMVFLSDNVLMPIGGFFLCILVGYLWGVPNLLREVSSGGRYHLHATRTLRFVLRVLAPLMIAVIFVVSLAAMF